MKPLPAEGSVIDRKPLIHSLPTVLPPAGTAYSATNRKAQVAQINRSYPLLLMASTLIAGFFCYLYMTKPVLLPGPEPFVMNPGSIPNTPLTSLATAAPTTVDPSAPGLALDRLPGDSLGRPSAADPRSTSVRKNGPVHDYEETNLRVQHVMTAEAPGGEVNRITLDVPVLYRSRNLRWSQQDVSKARSLLNRLAEYQERTRALRAEGIGLLDAWNQLVDQSIPTAGLRADSPSLTANQGESSYAPRSGGLDTTESIRIQSSGK
jgi:hypothetical protein